MIVQTATVVLSRKEIEQRHPRVSRLWEILDACKEKKIPVLIAAIPTVEGAVAFSENPPDYRLPPPRLDEHGAEIRRWLSGREERSA